MTRHAARLFAVAAAAVVWASPSDAQRTLMASPTCEELTIMDFLTRLDEEKSRYKRGLDDQDRRDLAQLRREVCAPYVGYRVTRQPTVTYSNGRAIVRNYLELNYPTGQVAKTRSGAWYYPSGARARSPLGQWDYANGMLARTKNGEWYTKKGKYVKDRDAATAQACEYLGKQLCPLGKADDDLLSVTVMGLINQAAPPKLEPAEGHDERGGEKDQ
jgi:hypothetical protein